MATGFSSEGSVNTRWKWGTGRMRSARASIHFCWAAAWHLGQ
nr:hypothetical protein [Holophaga foetida]